jgi:hypothetical protein
MKTSDLPSVKKFLFERCCEQGVSRKSTCYTAAMRKPCTRGMHLELWEMNALPS